MNIHESSVAIVGANFAGLSAAAQLAGTDGVCLIDPHPWFEFLPNIHELISRHKKPSDLRLDKKRIVARMGHQLIEDRVVNMDPEARELHTEQGRKIRYASCIMAIGGVNNSGQVPGVTEHTLPFKSVDQCAEIGDRLAALANRNRPFSVVIVGAGIEGIEALGEVLRAYRTAPVSIHLVERNRGFATYAPEKIGREIRRLCQGFPVYFHFGAGVSSVQQHTVTLSTGEMLATDLTIWTGGVVVNPLLQTAGLVREGEAWAAVDSHLQSAHFEDVFIAGDSVSVAGAEEKQGYYALAMGEIAGKNAGRSLQHQPLVPYVPQTFPGIYSFGDLSCFLAWKGGSLAGLPLHSIKESIYQYNMALMQQSSSLADYAEIGLRSVSGAFGLGLSCLRSPISLFQKSLVRWL